MPGKINVEKRDAVAIVTLENPQKRNALDPPMLEALIEVMARPPEGVRALVLTAAGDRAITSGYDISALTDIPPSPAEHPFATRPAALHRAAPPADRRSNG